MTNHTDSLAAAAWHLQLAGRKRWRLSGLAADGESMVTYEDVLHPGEQLYYDAHWAHETRCLDTPTVSVSHSAVPPSPDGARPRYWVSTRRLMTIARRRPRRIRPRINAAAIGMRRTALQATSTFYHCMARHCRTTSAGTSNGKSVAR